MLSRRITKKSHWLIKGNPPVRYTNVQARKSVNNLRYVLVAVAALVVAYFLALRPMLLDYPLTHLLNGDAPNSLQNYIAYALFEHDSFGGVLFIALIWSCWFGAINDVGRAKLMLGVLVAFPAGIVSRLAQYRVPSHLRPLYDPEISFHAPSILDKTELNRWDSFPSDHATVLASLAVVICLARPKLTLIVVPWLIVLELARVKMGGHYPSDVIGGAALGVAIVLIVQSSFLLDLCEKIVVWGRRHAAIFYFVAIFLTYQIGTLFGDVRSMASHLAFIHRAVVG